MIEIYLYLNEKYNTSQNTFLAKPIRNLVFEKKNDESDTSNDTYDGCHSYRFVYGLVLKFLNMTWVVEWCGDSKFLWLLFSNTGIIFRRNNYLQFRISSFGFNGLVTLEVFIWKMFYFYNHFSSIVEKIEVCMYKLIIRHQYGC